jgi:fermentation-respiration switch protein FrsA (DUF1100 family)
VSARSIGIVVVGLVAAGFAGVYRFGWELSRPVPARLGSPPALQQLFAAASEPKELWLIPDAAHADFLGFSRDDYQRRVLTFFDRALRARPPA